MLKYLSYKFLKEIVKFCPIRYENEFRFATFLLDVLQKNGIKAELRKFSYRTPRGSSKLIADDEVIRSLPSSFLSGKINEKILISNVDVGRDFEKPSIAFNPYSKEISLVTIYKLPSITISSKDVNKVIKAKEIKGKVKIKKEKVKSAYIYCGNIRNPRNIVFTHYDTVLNGAVDNSSGVSVIVSILLEKKEKVLENNAFFICGAEEIAYDEIYWGYGYRVVEEDFKDILFRSKKILVVDSIGFEKPKIIKNREIMFEAFPIRNIEKLEKKINILSSIDEKTLYRYYEFYHSFDDDLSKIDKRLLEEGKRVLMKILKN